MQRLTRLVAVLSVSLAPVAPPYLTVKAQPGDDPPSITLPANSSLPFAESSEAGLTEVKIGQSYYEQQQAQLKIEAEKAAELARVEAAKKAAQAKKRTLATQPASASDSGGIKETAKTLVLAKWDASQWEAFDFIVTHESGWNTQAKNASSGACGLGQALPCSKMPGGLNASAEAQISWVISYIANRYGTPNAAKAFWLSHRWY